MGGCAYVCVRRRVCKCMNEVCMCSHEMCVCVCVCVCVCKSGPLLSP